LGADWDAPAESSAVGVTESEAYTAGAAAENLLSRSGSPGRVAARGLAWDAVAEVTGAPVVVPTVLDPSRSREALRIVDAAGRSAAASRRWSRDPDDPAVAALFTPSGRLDMDEQRAVIRTFQPRPPVLNPTPDAVDRGCHRHLRRRCPVRPGWFVGFITTTIKGISHVERS
jgi:hypothetical protein